MNKLLVNGNVVRDMEVKDTGKCLVGNFTIANNVGYGEDQKTNFINCVLFGDRVESLVEYLVKGCKVLVEGELAIEQYEVNDEKRYTTKVYVKSLEIEKFKEQEDKKNKEKFKKGDKIANERIENVFKNN